MSMAHTFVVYVADHPGVLTRVASQFRRRGYNIESLVVGRTHIPDISRMTVVVAIDKVGATLVEANLYKLPEVLQVHDITSVPSVSTELVMVKLGAGLRDRAELMPMLEKFGCRILEAEDESMVIEATGAEEVIDRLVEATKPYRILDMTRTGRIAMTRNSSPISALGFHQTSRPSTIQ